MLSPILIAALVSLITFGMHAAMTGIVVVLTQHVAGRTDDLHVFQRVSALMLVTVATLMVTHIAEISVWATLYGFLNFETDKASAFEFAFENYTALGYGDQVPSQGYRLIGPITALNGLLLIGWSVAIIFEVLKMAEVQVTRKEADGAG